MDANKRISYLALLFAGFAAVLSVASLLRLNTAAGKFKEEKDRRLELEARIAAVDRKAEEIQSMTMQEMASRLSEICKALNLECGDGSEAAAPSPLPTVPEEFLARVGAPKKSGTRIEVAVPGEVTSAILSNVDVLKGEADLEPAARNNRPDGFRLTVLRENGLGRRIGLQPGDVIRAVNGLPFTTTEEIVKVFESLEDGRAASISFDIRRGGEELQIVIEDPKRQPVIVPVNP